MVNVSPGRTVLRGVGVGAGQDGQHVEFVDLEVEAEISAPGQRSGDDFAAGLAERIAVQREQNAGFPVWVVRTSRVDSMLFDPWVSSVWSTCASRAQAP